MKSMLKEIMSVCKSKSEILATSLCLLAVAVFLVLLIFGNNIVLACMLGAGVFFSPDLFKLAKIIDKNILDE